MEVEAVLKEVIIAGAMAPSGDNSQPWRFAVQDNEIWIYGVFGKDNAFLNYKQGGTLIALGAVIENMVMKARALGYSADVHYEEPTSDGPVARITLLPTSEKGGGELAGVIPQRHTNRTRYKGVDIPQTLLEKIRAGGEQGLDVSITIVTDKKIITELADAGSQAEIVILENEPLHSLLFRGVVWSKKEETQKKEGLFVKTLELNPIQELLFSLCRNWRVMRFFNLLKLPHLIAKSDAAVFASAPAFVLIFGKETASKDFLAVGRSMERMWLLANQNGLAVHPIVATLFFGLRLREGEEEGLTPHYWEMMRSSYEKIERQASGERKIPLFMFRMGYAKEASERSSKKAPHIVSATKG